ncbi:uncharacterized protein A1O5_06026 [Cladophialophora psammophila CBS 110553]|uniref:Uncharacterized protein n=1 Tax=Cladophialophora psammophila CBS 110553 TaxID=1182543 RepID=W9WSX1_9EURO|nr:uncharacterized protein A1O5_06026 [Cladophialophora psammophila CBS 110553]EXJ71033.1 hypothetical protein A1O5_06026 [Cladophialophora psammophila CBS 110553]
MAPQDLSTVLLLWLLIALSLIPISVAAELITQSTNATLPNGISNHGDPNLLCTSTKWSDVAFFFIGNYAAHAGTVVSLPGESTMDFVVTVLLALVFPSSGALRGFRFIGNRTMTRDPLQIALKAGALCMVVRAPNWSPKSGDCLHTLSFVSEDMISTYTPTLHKKKALDRQNIHIVGLLTQYIGISKAEPLLSRRKVDKLLKERRNPVEELNSLKQCTNPRQPVQLSVETPPWLRGSFLLVGRKIHGNLQLPQGYTLVEVPRDASVESYIRSIGNVGDSILNRFETEVIAASYSAPKALVAVAQAVYASVTLYRSRGDQITRYGYAAFGLTVVPYIAMSLMNLLSTLVTPEYAALYMIGSGIMDEAKTRGGVFESVVGRLVDEEVTIDQTFLFSGSFKERDEDHNCEDEVGDNHRESRKMFELSLASEQVHNPASVEKPASEEPAGAKEPEQKTGAVAETSWSAPVTSMTQQRGSTIWAFTRTTQSQLDPMVTASSRLPRDEPCIVVPACYNFKRKITKYSRLDCHYPHTVTPGPLQVIFDMIVRRRNPDSWAATFTLSAIWIAIIGGMSHFKPGSSTLAQRAWIMTWMVYGIFVGGMWRPKVSVLTELWRQTLMARRERIRLGFRFYGNFFGVHIALLYVCLYSTPAVGGFVVVAKMIWEYGNCQRI